MTRLAHNHSFHSLVTYLLAPMVILLAMMALAFAHGGEKHEETDSAAVESPAAEKDSKRATLDSIYVLINAEFESMNAIFVKGCFNCHTSRTQYPWYYKLPFVKGLIDDDISEAQKHLDMTDGFPFGGHGRPVDDLVAVKEEIQDGDMPPLMYRLMHWSAKPSDEEADSIAAWVDRGVSRLAEVGVKPTE